MAANKKQKCDEGSGAGGLQEEAVHANATFEFNVRYKNQRYRPIYGRILVGGEKVGSIEGTLVNRTYARNLSNRISFQTLCAQVRSHRWVHYPYSYRASNAYASARARYQVFVPGHG